MDPSTIQAWQTVGIAGGSVIASMVVIGGIASVISRHLWK